MKKIIAISLLGLVFSLNSAFAFAAGSTDDVVTIHLTATSGTLIGSLSYGVNNPFMPAITDGAFISSMVNGDHLTATVTVKKTGPAFAGGVTIFPSLEMVGWSTSGDTTTFSTGFGCFPATWNGVGSFSTSCKI